MMHPSLPLTLLLLVSAVPASAQAILSSWYTKNSGVLCRVIQSPTLTTPVTTWPASGVTNNNTGAAAQTVQTYADVQRIRYTATDVYINANGLASYTLGPWLTNTGGLFGFWPLARDYSTRITRTPVINGTKVRHGGGMIGMMVNGVAIYDLGDAFSFNQTNTTAPATPSAVTGTDGMGATGDGFWSRDALAVEVVTFDPGFAHQPGNNGQYHYHAEPKALRYQLGDNMKATYNVTNNTNTYTEDFSNPHHSPILGWCFDGLPIYGPYAYDGGVATVSGGAVTAVTKSTSPVTYTAPPTIVFTGGGGSGAAATAVLNAGVISSITMVSGGSGYTSAPAVTILGGVRRMRNGFVLRNGANGTQNLVSTGRKSLPKWAVAAQSYTTGTLNGTTGDYDMPATEWGPVTTYQTTGPGGVTIYSLGRYIGDYDYLGDRGQTQGVGFDMDQYNGRYCVTPEFPNGTYAYFVTVDAAGNPAFPYMLGKQYFGTSNATNPATVPVGATELFNGGPNIKETWVGGPATASNGNVTLTWNSVEGGTYKVEASDTLSSWSTLSTTVPGAANSPQTSFIESAAAPPGVGNHTRRFYRVTRTGTAAYDPAYTGQ